VWSTFGVSSLTLEEKEAPFLYYPGSSPPPSFLPDEFSFSSAQGPSSSPARDLFPPPHVSFERVKRPPPFHASFNSLGSSVYEILRQAFQKILRSSFSLFLSARVLLPPPFPTGRGWTPHVFFLQYSEFIPPFITLPPLSGAQFRCPYHNTNCARRVRSCSQFPFFFSFLSIKKTLFFFCSQPSPRLRPFRPSPAADESTFAPEPFSLFFFLF